MTTSVAKRHNRQKIGTGNLNANLINNNEYYYLDYAECIALNQIEKSY